MNSFRLLVLIVALQAFWQGSASGQGVFVANVGETNRTTTMDIAMLSGVVTGKVEEVGFGWGPTDGGAKFGAWAHRVVGQRQADGQVRAYVSPKKGPNVYRFYAKVDARYVWAPVPFQVTREPFVPTKGLVDAQWIAMSLESEAWFKRNEAVHERYATEHINEIFTFAHDPERLRRLTPQGWNEWFAACNGILVVPPVAFSITTSYTHRGELFRGIFYRLEGGQPMPGTSGFQVCYGYDVFRVANGTYRQTDDVWALPVGSVPSCNGLTGDLESWRVLHEQLAKTDLPPAFYAPPGQ